jgi:DNA-directed RNA polymerase subunit M/transcription elongation factor TFIIS
LKKFKKDKKYVAQLEQEIWKITAQSDDRERACARVCRQIVRRYRGEVLSFVEIARRTPMEWLSAVELAEWKRLQCEAEVQKKASLLQFAQNKSLLQCVRCKQFKVSYFQRQTRSADEPMSVFATCHACGKKWKQ